MIDKSSDHAGCVHPATSRLDALPKIFLSWDKKDVLIRDPSELRLSEFIQIIWAFSFQIADIWQIFTQTNASWLRFYSGSLSKNLLNGASGPYKEMWRDLDSSEMIWCKDQNNFCLWRESGIFAALVCSVETVFTEVHCSWIVLDIIVMAMLMIIYI